jgi:ribonuclease P protein component
MNFTYPKKRKTKSKINWTIIFEGKSVSKYPLRLVYHCGPSSDDQKNKMGVSVSKNFKKAVDRIISNASSETYRLNKHILLTI